MWEDYTAMRLGLEAVADMLDAMPRSGGSRLAATSRAPPSLVSLEPPIPLHDAHAQLQSPLLSLPPEVRLLIYRHLLVRPNNTSWRMRRPVRAEPRTTAQQQQQQQQQKASMTGLNILQTCRSVYSEALHVMYSENLIQVSSKRAGWWLLATSDDRTSLIRRLRLTSCQDEKTLTLLRCMKERFKALQEIVIRRERRYFWSYVVHQHFSAKAIGKRFREHLLAFPTLTSVQIGWANTYDPREPFIEQQNREFDEADRLLVAAINNRQRQREEDQAGGQDTGGARTGGV